MGLKKEYVSELLSEIKKKKLSKDDIAKLKIRLCKKHGIGKIPTDIEVLLNAPEADIPKVKRYLLTKPTRTISGVSVVAIMTSPAKCPHGKCLMCPGGVESEFGTVPQSYTGKEPATRRAIRNGYDPYLQVFNRLEQYVALGQVPQKVELIIMGGTFPARDKTYRDRFVAYSFKAMNDFSAIFFRKSVFDIKKFKGFFEMPGDIDDPSREARLKDKMLALKGKASLEREQMRNESSEVRCISLVIETRPDFAKEEHVKDMLRLGATKVELGFQSPYDDVLKKIERGHTVKDNIIATRTLKDYGFKINYHVMPGLPGSDSRRDVRALKELFDNPYFRPDMLKIYPCMVLKGTRLYDLWKKGKFKPITTKKAARIIVELKKVIPPYVRIMRVQRDIPTFMIEDGVDRTNLRQYVQELMQKDGVRCGCIRCREIGRNMHDIKSISYEKMIYEASEGIEFFISAESDDSIVGFLRMRFPSNNHDTAMVRELHVYGESLAFSEKGAYQHRGIGKTLLKKAEAIAKEYGKQKVLVISGIGVRPYYRKLGYRKVGWYMGKTIVKKKFS